MPEDNKPPRKTLEKLTPLFSFLVCVAIFLAVTIAINWE